MINIDLTGKTAIVTGGQQGLGAACCQKLHQAGANLVINYFNDPQGQNQQRAQQLTEELTPNAIALEADVRDPQAIAQMFDQTIQKFSAIDIVVNNAAIIRDKSIKKMEPQHWQDVIDTNLTGVFNVCQQAALKLADNGKIINFASITAFLGFFGQTNYAAAKAGVVAITKVLSKELAKRNITVNAVAPGVVLTEMGKTIPQEVRDQMLKNIPLARFGQPDEVANVVLFLASPLASYLTGQTIHINGGWTA